MKPGPKKGYRQTDEHKAKKSLALKKGAIFRCLQCDEAFWRKPFDIKNGDNKFCSRLCYAAWQSGKKKTDEFIQKLRDRNFNGSRNPNWKGGITSANKLARNSSEFKRWRASVFARDNWTCRKCNKRSKANNYLRIEAHHIKPFATFPEIRYCIDNGVTLCKKCHDMEPKGREVYSIT